MAKIKLKYDKQEEVPEAHTELYEERDGAWHLTGVEGMKTSADIDALKKVVDKERKARGEAEARAKKYEKLGDRDPDEVLEALDSVDDLKAQVEAAGKSGDRGASEETIKARIDAKVKAETTKLQRELATIKAEAETHKKAATELDAKMKKARLEGELQKAGAAAKLRPEAMADLLRYSDVFEVSDDDKIVTRDGVGYPPGMEVDVWLSDRKNDRAHWWPESTGGGSKTGGGGGPTGNNPFSPKAFNFTEASKLMASDPAKAAQYARAAGFPTPADAMVAGAQATPAR